MAQPQPIVVIGASAGGVQALRLLAAELPGDFPAAVFVVLHTGAHKSNMPELLNHAGELPAVHARSGDPISPGRIYVAPPDHHLLIEPGKVRLSKGPRENWARPAIDPLFRSAARCYGAQVIGVILTGGLNDGTAGLYEIKEHGGTTVVQDPDDAENPSMPRSALAHVTIDHCLPLKRLPRLLVDLVTGKTDAAFHQQAMSAPERTVGHEMTTDYTLERPIAVTCPDCGGALRQTKLGTLSQFRCHIGHVYTAEVMMHAQFAALEQALEMAMRALSERGELCRQMAEMTPAAGDSTAAREWGAAEKEAKEQTFLLREILEREWMQPDDSKGPNFHTNRPDP